jgi:hypothetical protein
MGMYTDEVKNDKALSIEFENNGYQSKQFIKNAGSSLIFIMVYLMGWLILFIITIISKYTRKTWKIYQRKLKTILMWN